MQRLSKFVESVSVLVLYRNVDTDEQSKDASFVENSNKIPMNMATLDVLWSENASRNDA